MMAETLLNCSGDVVQRRKVSAVEESPSVMLWATITTNLFEHMGVGVAQLIHPNKKVPPRPLPHVRARPEQAHPGCLRARGVEAAAHTER